MGMNHTVHNWKCEDTPGYYICNCGATGIWNRSLEKIEVEEPIPYEVYKRRHLMETLNSLPE
jgi:hypothetical protein